MSAAVAHPTPRSTLRDTPAPRDKPAPGENSKLPFAELVRQRLEEPSAGPDMSATDPGHPPPVPAPLQSDQADEQQSFEGIGLPVSLTSPLATTAQDERLTPEASLASADPFLARGMFGRQEPAWDVADATPSGRGGPEDVARMAAEPRAVLAGAIDAVDGLRDAVNPPTSSVTSARGISVGTRPTAFVARPNAAAQPVAASGPMDAAVETSANPASISVEDGEREPGDAGGPASARQSSIIDEFASRSLASSVFVALRAMDEGIRVIARVGQMDLKERARLRHAVSALLAEFGAPEAGFDLSTDHALPAHRRTGGSV